MKEVFDQILNTFENKDVREFAEKCIDAAPQYFFEVGASSTGKYHPQYALGVGGLARHTVALVRILNHMFGVESIANQFTSRERDLLRVAGIAHDMQKSGTQVDFEKNKYTKFDHPLRAAKFVESIKDDHITDGDKHYITHCIESHMGAFNTDRRNPGIVLPKPEDKHQVILHLADYLASRKDLEVLFDNLPEVDNRTDNSKKLTPDDVDVNDFQIKFGKYAGLTWPEIEAENPGYLDWGKDKEGFAFDVLRKYLKEKTS